jgi:hypothetical protein
MISRVRCCGVCWLLSVVCVGLIGGSVATAAPPATESLFAKNNLVAWCIVPFDARQRGPAERAELLHKLGFTKFAYDWRDEHLPTFEQEILELKKQNVEFFAYWCPLGTDAAYRSMMGLVEKYQLHPQLWTMAPAAEADSPQKRVEINAQALLPYVEEAKRLGCRVALYNHGGWGGEPANMIAMVQWLQQRVGKDSVGIVYNFHHGHEHLASFPAAFKAMVPYLTCVNLNGMTAGPETILPIGQGKEDQRLLTMIRESGYRGPIGILGHRADVDAELALQQNLDGLKQLLPAIGEAEAAKSYQP